MSNQRLAIAVAVLFAMIASVCLISNSAQAQGGKTLTNDPLTGLPIPPSEDRMHLGNEPMKLDPAQMCKSTMTTNFYSPNGLKMNATATWFESKLSGFKKVSNWHVDRTTTVFYKADGTVAVALTGSKAPQGQDTGVYAITYSTFAPPLPEKAFAGMTTGNVDCR
jgi:hypothetical protein